MENFLTRQDEMCKPENIWEELTAFQKQNKSLSDVEYNYKIIDKLVEILTTYFKCEHITKREDTVENNIICEYCSDILYEPVTLICGHTYCNLCVSKRYKQSCSELCTKCDIPLIPVVQSRWLCTIHKNYNQCNVVLSAIIEDHFLNLINAIKLKNSGNELASKKEFNQAEKLYLDALKLDPLSFSTWCNLSFCYASVGNFESALPAAKKAALISPMWAKAYYREGIAYQGLKQYTDSLISFTKYLILKPTSLAVRKFCLKSLEGAIQAESHDHVAVSQLSNSSDFTDSNGLSDSTILSIEIIFKKLINRGIEFKKNARPGIRKLDFNDNPVSKSKLKVELTCPLCCRVLLQATTTPCGHTFCSSCLERSLDYSNLCSICRSPLNELIPLQPKPVNNIIEGLVQKYFSDDYKERIDLLKKENQVYLCDGSDEVTIPIFVCSFTFPLLKCPLHIFESRYKLLIRRCIETDTKMFGMCMYEERKTFADFGIMLNIEDYRILDDGRYLVSGVGGKRFKVMERGKKDGYNTAKVTWVKDEVIPQAKRSFLESYNNTIYKQCETWLNRFPSGIQNRLKLHFGQLPEQTVDELYNENGPHWLWWILRLLLQGDQSGAVRMLQSSNVEERLNLVREKTFNLITY